ncbi:MAG: RNA-binding S4 domain-containing protein [Polyangiaceae bacterium]|nr:RNA-binding S4 domain-containing protein [Polyangiaceae bacterium]
MAARPGVGEPIVADPDLTVRLDQWLCAARIYPSRSLAARACAGGLVKLNDVAVRPSHVLRIGDRVTAQAPRGPCVLVVKDLEPKRQSPSRARDLYEDHSPPPPPREERVALRTRGAGRPTKADRRATDRLRRLLG